VNAKTSIHNPLVPRDLVDVLEAEAIGIGERIIEDLIRFGDPRECGCCSSRRRDRHCSLCHREPV
jgi:hypothetical protein